MPGDFLSDSPLQETLQLVSLFLSDAFTDGKKLLESAEIYDDYIPGMTFNLAVKLGWIPKPPTPVEGGVYFGDLLVSEKDREDFISFLPVIRELGKHFRENPAADQVIDWVEPTPDKRLQRFKDLTAWSEDLIAAKVGCSERTLQRFKKRGYQTHLSILKALADLMKREQPAEFKDLHFHQLMWRQKED